MDIPILGPDTTLFEAFLKELGVSSDSYTVLRKGMSYCYTFEYHVGIAINGLWQEACESM